MKSGEESDSTEEENEVDVLEGTPDLTFNIEENMYEF